MAGQVAPVTAPQMLTVFTTANLRGAVELLPRLASLILRERRAAEGLTLLLDLGDTCAAESQLCRETQGRAPFLVLDAIGYDAAFIGGETLVIPPAAFRRLKDRIVMPVFLWHRASQLVKRGETIRFAAGNASLPEGTPGFRIDRARPALPDADGQPVMLGDVPHAHLARMAVRWPEGGVEDARLIALPDDEPPDPTITAVVELVAEEAQHFAQQQGDTS